MAELESASAAPEVKAKNVKPRGAKLLHRFCRGVGFVVRCDGRLHSVVAAANGRVVLVDHPQGVDHLRAVSQLASVGAGEKVNLRFGCLNVFTALTETLDPRACGGLGASANLQETFVQRNSDIRRRIDRHVGEVLKRAGKAITKHAHGLHVRHLPGEDAAALETRVYTAATALLPHLSTTQKLHLPGEYVSANSLYNYVVAALHEAAYANDGVVDGSRLIPYLRVKMVEWMCSYSVGPAMSRYYNRGGALARYDVHALEKRMAGKVVPPLSTYASTDDLGTVCLTIKIPASCNVVSTYVAREVAKISRRVAALPANRRNKRRQLD